MATTVFGASKPTARDDGGVSPVQGASGERQASILDVGSVATGDADPIVESTGIDGDNDSYIDPTSADSGDSDAPYGYTKSGRKRNRPVGSGKRTNPGTRTSKTTRDISNILFSIHMMGATFIKVPELCINEDEAKALSDAVTRVTELYDVPMMDERAMAWVNLAMVAGSVYGPRMVAVKMNRSKSKQPRQNMGVVEMPGTGTGF